MRLCRLQEAKVQAPVCMYILFIQALRLLLLARFKGESESV